jgi:hypothetical protein
MFKNSRIQELKHESVKLKVISQVQEVKPPSLKLEKRQFKEQF